MVEHIVGEMKWDGRKLAMNLHGLVKVWVRFSLICLVYNVKKIAKKMLDRAVTLPGRHSKLIQEAILGLGRRTVDFGRVKV